MYGSAKTSSLRYSSTSGHETLLLSFPYWISIDCRLMCQGKVVVEAAKGEKLVLPDEEVIENKVIKN